MHDQKNIKLPSQVHPLTFHFCNIHFNIIVIFAHSVQPDGFSEPHFCTNFMSLLSLIYDLKTSSLSI